MYINILIFLLILILILIIANIIVLCHNKLSYMGGVLKKGGALTPEDINIINDQIMSKLYEFNLITPQSSEMSSAKLSEMSSAKLSEMSSAKSSEMGSAKLSIMEFAKASILEKRGRCSIEEEVYGLPSTSTPIKSDVYFHMIKIIDANITQWQEFEQKIKSMEENIQVMYNGKSVNFTTGLNHFNIRERVEDLFVAYASIKPNLSIFPPDWKDVECMVSIIAKEGIPYFTNMGIFTMMHTFPILSYNFIEDKAAKKIILRPYRSDYTIDPELSRYFEDRNESYPAHKYISVYLFTFIGSRINNFYVDEKTALFTSPTEEIVIILSKVFNKYKIMYGLEVDNRLYRYRGLENGNNYSDSCVRLKLYNNEPDNTDKYLELHNSDLRQLCPWYCNIFELLDGTMPPDEPECYSGAISMDPFVYVPISSFIKLSRHADYIFSLV